MDRPFGGSALLEGNLVEGPRSPPGGQLCSRLLAGLDLASAENLELGRQQRDAPDLLQVGAHGIGCLGVAVAAPRLHGHRDDTRARLGECRAVPAGAVVQQRGRFDALEVCEGWLGRRRLVDLGGAVGRAGVSVEPVTPDSGACSVVPVILPPDSAATATLPIDSQPQSRQVKSYRRFPAPA